MTIDINNNARYRQVLTALEDRQGNLFVTGKAGTGKSTLLRHIAAMNDRNTVVLAPTGLAALNAGGMTIHSFFKLPIRPLIPGDSGIPKFGLEHVKFEIIRNADLIIIDEISMVRADILDAIDHSLRINCRSNSPFAGKQVIIFGDMFQLEPVITDNQTRAFIEDYYPSAFFFDAYCYRQAAFKTIELTKVYRQRDPEFIRLLNKVRVGTIGQEDIKALNDRCYRQTRMELDDFAINLCTSNRLATGINVQRMSAIRKKSHIFIGVISNRFDVRSLPTAQYLELKEGAKVMILKNGNQYANGTIAILEEITKEYCRLRLPNGEMVDITPYTWEQLEFTYCREERRIISQVVGTYTQMPLAPAWAITIHKSQGLTFDTVNLDLGQGTFAAGQAYVGLSRCTSFTGLSFARKLYADDILIHPRVLEFNGMEMPTAPAEQLRGLLGQPLQTY